MSLQYYKDTYLYIYINILLKYSILYNNLNTTGKTSILWSVLYKWKLQGMIIWNFHQDSEYCEVHPPLSNTGFSRLYLNKCTICWCFINFSVTIKIKWTQENRRLNHTMYKHNEVYAISLSLTFISFTSVQPVTCGNTSPP